MSAVIERISSELEKMAKEAKDEKTLKEILKMEIRLQRGSLKGKIKPGPLTRKEKEEALIEYFKKKGWSTEGIEEYFYKESE